MFALIVDKFDYLQLLFPAQVLNHICFVLLTNTQVTSSYASCCDDIVPFTHNPPLQEQMRLA